MKRTILIIFCILLTGAMFAGQSEIENNESNSNSRANKELSEKELKKMTEKYLGKRLLILSLNMDLSYNMSTPNFKTIYSPGIMLDYYFNRKNSHRNWGFGLKVSYSIFDGDSEISNNNYSNPHYLDMEITFISKIGITHCYISKVGLSYTKKIAGEDNYNLTGSSYHFNDSAFGFTSETGYQYISPTSNFTFHILFVMKYKLSLYEKTEYGYEDSSFYWTFGVSIGFGFNLF